MLYEQGFAHRCSAVIVPVIAIFTKADALQLKAYSELYEKLQCEGRSMEDALEEAMMKAVAYEKAQLEDNSDRLNGAPHCPTAIVVFRSTSRIQMSFTPLYNYDICRYA